VTQTIPQVYSGRLAVPATGGEHATITLGSPDWYGWLRDNIHFTFTGDLGTFTARKERRARGDEYWYVYRKHAGKLHKAYLGRSADLSPERLYAVTSALTRRLAGGADSPGELHNGAHSAATPDPGEALLLTKLTVPRPPAGLIPRPRLSARLAASAPRPLTLVAAPAGFGKTTLVSEWARQCELPIAWVSLDAADSDPARFWRYVIAALDGVHPGVGAGASFEAAAVLRAPGPVSASKEAPALLTPLLNALAAAPGDLLLVLDDYHLIDAPEIHEGMAFLLDHLPATLRLVIAGRGDPPLPLARLRARGQVSELRAADLRFTQDEAAAFFRRTLGLDLSAPDLAALDARTEGWIAGLQLAALSLRDAPDGPDVARLVTGDDRHILDYLVAEVLAHQPPAVQEFLLQTAVLPRLSGPLCDAVTGQPGGQAMLERLEAANLFLIPLDNTRGWYRYHHLFAEVLRGRLRQAAPDSIPALHARAGAWHEQQGQINEAIEHALAAEDWARVLDLIEPLDRDLAARGEQATLRRWLSAVPDAILAARPGLCLRYAWALLFHQHISACERPLAVAEHAWRTAGDDAHLGEVLLLRSAVASFEGDIARALACAREALARLPATDLFQRDIAYSYVFHACRGTGDLAGAAAALAGQRALGRIVTSTAVPPAAAGILLGTEIAEGHLAVAAGRLREGAAAYRQAIRLAGRTHLRARMGAHWHLSQILREWNDLDAAEEHARQGTAICAQIGEALSLPEGHLLIARILAARGDFAAATQALEQAHDGARQVGRDPFVRLLATEAARIWLRQARLAEAGRWAATCDLPLDAPPPYERQFEYLTLVRVRLAQRLPGAAPRVLPRLIDAAEAAGRTREVIAISMLLALAHQARGATDLALPLLERALALAEPEGYIRLFVDEGAPLAALLDDLAARRLPTAYVRTLRAAFAADAAPAGVPIAYTTPLSPREAGVLRLLGQGASNDQIAAELTIAVETVKKHVSHIYNKLDVTSRTQAVARAQQLGLL
jgi:LuxR family maltose regulon positive regulatory protein